MGLSPLYYKMFALTSKFKTAVSIINEIDDEKFSKFLGRVLERLHIKQESTFNEAEKEKLCDLLELNLDQLHTLVDAVSYIFETTAYNSLNANTLGTHLGETGMTEQKIESFKEAWGELGREFVNKLKDRTLGGPLLLKDLNWRLHLQMSQAAVGKLRQPTALFEFKVGSETSTKDENLLVEFSHEELFSFFQDLEKIQAQLDSLSF